MLDIQSQLFINGEFVNSTGGETLTTINPANGEEIMTVHVATSADVDKAVSAAAEALKSWMFTNGEYRRDLLLKLADLIEANGERLAEIESLDNGKPRAFAAMADIPLTVRTYRYFAGLADKLEGRHIPMPQGHFAVSRREAIGVVGQIIPWNFPLMMQAWKLAPALAAGCTVVMKTSEKTPLTGLMVASLIRDAGFPPGVVNILTGAGDVGEMITRHMGIQKVAFTGSSLNGTKVIKAAAESNLKKVTLELGGKSALIVCKDADIDQAIFASQMGLFLNSGQCCCASSRILVAEEIYHQFCEKAKAMAESIHLCDPSLPACQQGPQVDRLQFDRVLGYIKKGKEEGATLLCGGEKALDKGFFIKPTIFAQVSDDMCIAREEIFGPVMQILTPFKSLDEAVARANSSEF